MSREGTQGAAGVKGPEARDPPMILGGGLAQTLMSGSPMRKGLARWRARRLLGCAEEMLLDAGDGVRLQCLLSRESRAGGEGGAPRPLVVLVHGWLGSHEAGYLLSCAAQLFGHADVARLDMVDHGGSQHLNEAVFRADVAHTQLRRAMRDLAGKVGAVPSLHLVGFSLGGNLALRAVREDREGIASVVAVCPSVEPGETARAILEGHWTLRLYFERRMRRMLRGKRRHWPDSYDWKAVDLRGGLGEMYRGVTQALMQVEAAAYERDHSVDADCLAGLGVPALVIAAEDDLCVPIGPVRAVLEAARKAGPAAELQARISARGGHCAFLRDWRLRSWVDQWASDWVQAHA